MNQPKSDRANLGGAQEFRLKPDAFSQLRNLVVGGMSLACFLFCALVWVEVREESPGLQVALIGAMAAVFFLITFWGVLRIRKQWGSYLITLDGELITRTVEEFETVDLHRDEIVGLQPLKNRGLKLLSRDPKKYLIIPLALLQRPQVLEWLPALETQAEKSDLSQRLVFLLGVGLTLLLTAGFLTARLFWVKVGSAFLLLDGLVFLLWWVNRHSGLNRMVRLGLSFTLMLWLVLLLAKVTFLVILP